MYYDFLNSNISHRGSRPYVGSVPYSITQDLGIIRFLMKKYGVSMREAYSMYGRFIFTGSVR